MANYSEFPRSETVDGVTENCQMVVWNMSESILRLVWLDFEHNPVEYAQIQPHGNVIQDTFTTHTWVVEDLDGNVWMDFQGMLPVFGSSRVGGIRGGVGLVSNSDLILRCLLGFMEDA
jgi:hypothetical protein